MSNTWKALEKGVQHMSSELIPVETLTEIVAYVEGSPMHYAIPQELANLITRGHVWYLCFDENRSIKYWIFREALTSKSKRSKKRGVRV